MQLFAFADKKKSRDFQISYRDTNSTYLQIFIQFMDSDQQIKDEFTFSFVYQENGKYKGTEVTRSKFGGAQPEIIPFNPGLYDIHFEGSEYPDMSIKENKLNIITLKVHLGKLSFVYRGATKEKVKNKAIVNRRFSTDATILQDCGDILEYKHGTYYIEINTLPTSKFTIDMRFGILNEINIEKPGKLIIDSIVGATAIQVEQPYYTGSELDFELGKEKVNWELLIRIRKEYTKQDPLLLQPNTYKIKWTRNNNRYEKEINLSSEQTVKISLKE